MSQTLPRRLNFSKPEPALPTPEPAVPAEPKKPSKKAEKKLKHKTFAQRGRLPDGSSFVVTFDAATMSWTGTLSTTIDGRPASFTSTRNGVFNLLRRLDTDYRIATGEWTSGRNQTRTPEVAK